MNRGTQRHRLHVVPPPSPQSNVVPLKLDVYLMQAAIHEGVCVTELVSALTRAGLTVSNVHGVGLVIHRAEHNPLQPSPGLPGVS